MKICLVLFLTAIMVVNIFIECNSIFLSLY